MVDTHQRVLVVDGADNILGAGSGGVIAEATLRSAAITVGGTAQDLMAGNPARQGWEIQNQSAGNLYVCSRGAGGAILASLDQNSLQLIPGAYYQAPHVTRFALSIIGATTAQAFYAREW